MKTLMDQHHIANFRLLSKSDDSTPSIYSKNLFLALNKTSQRWEFDWNIWKEQLNSTSETIPKKKSEESILKKIQLLDVQLLGQLTLDARQKNSEIIRKIGLDPNSPGVRQKVSRRLKFLKEYAIQNYRCFFNWEVFDTHHTFLFICKTSKSQSARLFNNLKENTIPFQSTFTIVDGGFLWAVQAPPSHFSHISSIVWENSIEQELILMDYKSSMVYGLWPATFDSERQQWKISIMKPEEIFAQLDL
ncbi:MAG: hypothetical protein ACTSR2_03640 [Candidatus Hodarchaeales archaeon]